MKSKIRRFIYLYNFNFNPFNPQNTTMDQPVIAPERITIRLAFDAICMTHPAWAELPYDTREMYLRRMERSCFNVTVHSCILEGINRLFTDKKFIQRYSTICSRVMANLDPAGSVGSNKLIPKLLAGEIDPYKIAELTSKDLCPEASKAERDDIELRQKQKSQGKVSRAYTCRKCGGQETIPIEYQARALDEGSSYSIKCVNCEFVWRR